MAEIVDFGLQQHKIKMDSRYFENVLSVVAGDTGRRIEVQLLDTNGTVQDTTGLNLRLNALVAGKTTFTDATLVDAVTGKYQLDLSNGMFLAPGNWQFQWSITDSAGKKLHSFAFTGNIGKNISEGGSQATNFYLNLEDLKKMQDDLINGTIDSSILEMNIAEKLTDLETQYAPKLTEVTAQLAQIVNLKPSGVFNTLSELTSTYPTGSDGVYIIVETGEWFFYEGTWKRGGVYQETQVTETINEIDLNLPKISITSPTLLRVEERNIIPIASYITIEVQVNYNPFSVYLLEKIDNGSFLIKGVEHFQGEYNKKMRVDTNLYASGNGREYVAVQASGGLGYRTDGVERQWLFTTTASVVGSLPGDIITGATENNSQITITFNTILRHIKYLDKIKKIIVEQDMIKEQINTMGSADSRIKQKVWLAMGDSITFGLNATTNYAKLIAERNFMTLNNYGVSGNAIADSPDGSHSNAMVYRVDSMRSDADIITVFGGTNDFGYQRPIGTFNDRGTDTFYGAMHIIISKLYTQYPKSKIAFILPTPRTNDVKTIPLSTYLDVMREVLAYYAVPFLDLSISAGYTARNTASMNMMIPDGLHPSDDGHRSLADKIESFLISL